ncbi:MAG: type I-E CRISPR-associated protein Cse1/CasA [Terriglobia bacterium]
MEYNLLEEKWIPVLWKDGHSGRVGISEALRQAGRIRQIAASNPMDRLAILRFLLALLYWCKGNPPDDKNSISSFPSDWFKKLDDNKDCFNLQGDGKRFYQRKPNRLEKKLSVNYLMQEVPTGTNFWHFRHGTDFRNGLCPACCAMGLLRLPLFATSAGRGKPPGVNQKPPIYIVPMGDCLSETLRLSWRKTSEMNLGTPTWENPDISLPQHGNVPLLIGLTWVPRRVWLDTPETPESNCIACGRREALIRQCVFAGIGSTKTGEGSLARIWNDPHTISEGDEIVKPFSALGPADAAAGKWTKVVAGILCGEKPKGNSKLWVVSFATVQNDKYLEAAEREIQFLAALDDVKVQASLQEIQAWQKEGWKLVGRAKPRETSRNRGHLEILSAVAAVRPQAEATVSGKIDEMIAEGGKAWEEAAQEYRPLMAAVAKSLSPGYTTASLRRRQEIAAVKPDMRPKRNNKDEGGDK